MKIKKGFELRVVCGENIIVSYGEENMDFSKVISLNESAAYLWNAVRDKDFDETVLAELLQQEYDVDKDTALNDAADMLRDWESIGLVS